MRITTCIIAAITLFPSWVNAQPTTQPTPTKIQIAVYYFPNYHPNDPRNLTIHAPGWSEWDLVKSAKPRFPGHQQPKVPLWGYTDESNPAAMAQKIDAAADHGIDAFIFDWYHYDDGPYLNAALDNGFLHAPNNHRLKFALMWANHDVINIFPAGPPNQRKVLWPGKVTPEHFTSITNEIIQKYFKQPNYWTLDGKPYFSIYELSKLLDNFGSVQATRIALDDFRSRAIAAGLPGIHLNAVVWGQPVLPTEKTPVDPAKLVRDLGFDSVTSYVWIHHVPLITWPTDDYQRVRDAYLKYWDQADTRFGVPYFPNVSMGWDPTPRIGPNVPFKPPGGYPVMPVIINNTPANFAQALRIARNRLLKKPPDQRILTINAWNEWTEGSYLEPDTINRMGYLDAIRDVFGTGPDKVKG